MLTKEQFTELRRQGLSVEQIIKFEKGEKPQAQPVAAKKIEPKKSLGRRFFDVMTSSEQAFGRTIGTAASTIDKGTAGVRKGTLESQRKQYDNYMNIAKNEPDKERAGKFLRAAEETAKLINLDIYNDTEYQKTHKQVMGEALGTAADVAMFGKFGKGTGELLKGVTTGKQAFIKGFASYGSRGAAFGAAFGASEAMKQDKEIKDITKQAGKSALFSGLLAGAIGGISTRNKFLAPQKAVELKQKAIEQYKKGLNATNKKYKEITNKVVPELLDQEWWGTRKNLLKKAEANLSLSGEDYRKLGELQGVIQIKGLVGNIDKEIAKYTSPAGSIISVNEQKVKALQALKNDILTIDTMDKIKDGVASQEQLRKLAHFYGKEVYGTRRAQKTIMDNKTLSQVKKVDGMIRELLSKDPRNWKYSEINKVYHLNSGLAEILTETAIRKESGNVVKLVTGVTGGTGAIVGALGGGFPGALVGGITTAGLTEMLNSAWWNTLRAVQKNRLAEKLLTKSAQDLPNWINYINAGGAKAISAILSEDKN